LPVIRNAKKLDHRQTLLALYSGGGSICAGFQFATLALVKGLPLERLRQDRIAEGTSGSTHSLNHSMLTQPFAGVADRSRGHPCIASQGLIRSTERCSTVPVCVFAQGYKEAEGGSAKTRSSAATKQ